MGGASTEFLTTLCALYSFINALYIELLREIGEAGVWDWGESQGFPLQKKPWRVWTPLFFLMFCLAEVRWLLPGYT